MPIQNAFQPDMRPFREDYLAWAAKPKHGGLSLEDRGGAHVWVLTSKIDYNRHGGTKHRHFQTWYATPDQINTSVNWRRLVAAHIRSLRFALRRLDRPGTVDERRKPKLPYPQ